MYTNAAQAYGTQQVQGASPALQVAMLYERAITSLHDTVDAIEQGDIKRRWQSNKRANDIVTALLGSLDHDQGGEIASNLDQLYTYLLRRLPMVDVRNDPAPAQEAIELLKPLCSSWLQLARGQQTADGEEGDGAQADAAAPEPAPERAKMNVAI